MPLNVTALDPKNPRAGPQTCYKVGGRQQRVKATVINVVNSFLDGLDASASVGAAAMEPHAVLELNKHAKTGE